jgi:hypothetical protein
MSSSSTAFIAIAWILICFGRLLRFNNAGNQYLAGS